MSIYIMYSWYVTGKEKMDELVGISAPVSFIVELRDLASLYDDRIRVDAITAYHFGPKFLVELRCIMKRSTKLTESHDVALELQEAIQAHDDVERCFVHVCVRRRRRNIGILCKARIFLGLTPQLLLIVFPQYDGRC